MVSASVRYLFYQPMDEKIETWKLFVFPPKNTLINRRNCSIGQSCCSMTSKRSIVWFLESSRAWGFFTRAFALLTKSHASLCPFDKPFKSLYFRSFVVSVLFARFHFKVIRKSLYGAFSFTWPAANTMLIYGANEKRSRRTGMVRDTKFLRSGSRILIGALGRGSLQM